MNKRDTTKYEAALERSILYHKAKIKSIRKAIKELKDSKCHYRIKLRSMWGDHGEDDISYDAQPGNSLKKAAKDADEKFMRINKRSDVQAWRMADLVFENGEKIVVEHPYKKNKK